MRLGNRFSRRSLSHLAAILLAAVLLGAALVVIVASHTDRPLAIAIRSHGASIEYYVVDGELSMMTYSPPGQGISLRRGWSPTWMRRVCFVSVRVGRRYWEWSLW